MNGQKTRPIIYLNHDRNFVRHEVIPLLEQRWPEVSQRLLLTREAMTDTRHLLEKLADEYLEPNLIHPFVLRITPQCRANRGVIQAGDPALDKAFRKHRHPRL